MGYLEHTTLLRTVAEVLEVLKSIHALKITSIGNNTQLGYRYHGSCARIEEYFAGITADSNAYANLLQGCSKMKDLNEGKRIHSHMIKTGFRLSVFLQNNLVNMYARCGGLEDARQVFDKMPEPDIVSWNALISGYCRYGRFEDARQLFGKMPEPDVVSWNALISGYARHGLCENVLRQFCEMRRLGMIGDQFTFACILSSCGKLGGVEEGKQVHAHIIRSGFRSSIFVANALVDMYAKCGGLEEAHSVFDGISQRDEISWNALIAGYAQNGHGEKALKLFYQMQQENVRPTHFTFGSVLKACSNGASQGHGKEVHGYIIKNGFELDVYVGSAIVDMYAKCGDIEEALTIFQKMPQRDVVTYNALIAGLFRVEDFESGPKYGIETLKIFQQMQQIGMKPDCFTFSSILGACSSLASLEHGKQVHVHILKGKFELDELVGSALVDMYAKCGVVEDAWKWFNRLPKLDVVSWTTMVAGYAQNGHAEEAMELFCQVLGEGMKPDQFTLCTVLSASANLAAQEQGKQIHAHSIKSGFESFVVVGNALVDMYAKCGSIDDAGTMFGIMQKRDVVSWSVLISGYAQHGYAKEALKLFSQMQEEGMKPNPITFVGVLSACSHVGLVDEGCSYFNSMIRDHGIEPRPEHCACVVDLLGRGGHLDEAEDFIFEMRVESDAVVWRALLAASRIHGNLDVGKRAAEHIIELEPQTSGTYVLLSNIYASAGRWDDATKLRNMMKERGVKKEPGLSWIEVNNTVNCFTIGDKSHPEAESIYATLEILTKQMKAAGYVPDTTFVLHDVG